MNKPQALKAATRTQAALNKAEGAALEAARRRDAALLDAQAASATYAEIQAATGLSTARITQVLRRQRQAR